MKEEIDALAMLAKGISVTVETAPINYHGMKYADERAYEELKRENNSTTTDAIIFISIPENVDGYLIININSKNNLKYGKTSDGNSRPSSLEVEYRKKGNNVVQMIGGEPSPKTSNFVCNDGFCSKKMVVAIYDETYVLDYYFSSLENRYAVDGRDSVSIKGLSLCE